MFFASLSPKEQRIVLLCLSVITEGGFISGEFQTRLGIEPKELEQVISEFPNIDDSIDDSIETIAINNCLNEICNGLTLTTAEWSQWFNVDKAEIVETYKKWALIRGWKHTEI